MKECKICHQIVALSSGCTHPLVLINETWYDRIPNTDGTCRECRAKKGELHHFDCPNESDPSNPRQQMRRAKVKAVADFKLKSLQIIDPNPSDLSIFEFLLKLLIDRLHKSHFKIVRTSNNLHLHMDRTTIGCCKFLEYLTFDRESINGFVEIDINGTKLQYNNFEIKMTAISATNLIPIISKLVENFHASCRVFYNLFAEKNAHIIHHPPTCIAYFTEFIQKEEKVIYPDAKKKMSILWENDTQEGKDHAKS